MMHRCQELARNLTDPWARVEALGLVPNILSAVGDPQEADALFREHLAIRRDLGDEVRIAGILNSLGWAAILRADYEEARRFVEESLDIARRLRDTLRITLALGNLGLIAVFQGRYDEALMLLDEGLELCSSRGDRRSGGEVILGLAAAHAALRNFELATKLDATAKAVFEATSIVYPAAILDRLEPYLRVARAKTDSTIVRALAEQRGALTMDAAITELERHGLLEVGPLARCD